MKKHLVNSMLGSMLALMTLVVYTGVAPAAASNNTSPDMGTTKKAGVSRHCITGPGRPLQCFETEAEALRVASSGHIRLAPGQSSRSLSDDQLFSTQSDLYAILYEHADYGGATLSIYSGSCSGGNNMPSTWNDVVSSARTGICGITLYEHYNFTGSSLRINYPGTSYVGNAMNDKASSWTLP